jgi:hypothetical protein
MDESVLLQSPLLKPKAKPRLSKLRDCQVQTSLLAMNDVGVSTMDEEVSTRVSTMTELRDTALGISVPRTDSSTQHRETETINMELFQYPTFSEITRSVKSGSMIRRYELDRNSSIDDSSTDTTPGGDPYAVTNIVYSPLVNDISSLASSPDSHEKIMSASGIKIPVPSSNFFICPLYEKHKLDGDEPQAVEEPTYENTFKAAPRYENVNCIAVSYTQEDQPVSTPVNHYENEPVYQNDIMAEPSSVKNTIMQPFEPAVEEPSTPTAVEDVRYENVITEQPSVSEDNLQYENITAQSEIETTPRVEEGENLYETNVYEDIDDDENESLQGKNSYEDIESTLPSQTITNVGREGESAGSDSETAYESVQFSSHKNKEELPVNHHYTEIIEFKGTTDYENNVLSSSSMDSIKTETCVLSSTSASEEESNQSYSKTEDTVTCLEIKNSESSQFRSDSLDAEKSLDESSSNSNSCSTDASPTTEDEAIRHIDSPLMVDNPLYGIQLEDTVNLNEEVQRMSLEYNKQTRVKAETQNVQKSPEKLLGRCNSAPLTESGCDFALSIANRSEADISSENDIHASTTESEHITSSDVNRNNTLPTGREHQKVLLCKRLSEPSLNLVKTEENSGSGASWRYPDAKRLTHRKQSVKELLTKFESQETMSLSPAQSPTRASPVVLGSTISPTLASPGPGLPRPSSKCYNNNNSFEASPCLRDRNSPRFPHHRFSMGDILMSQSMNSPEEKSNLKEQSGLMSRSDTFPELRNEATKENESSCRLDYSDSKRYIGKTRDLPN